MVYDPNCEPSAPRGNDYVSRKVDHLIRRHGASMSDAELAEAVKSIEIPAQAMGHSFRYLVECDYRAQRDRPT